MAHRITHRIEVATEDDARAHIAREKLGRDFPVSNVSIIDAYTINEDLGSSQLEIMAEQLSNPVTQTAAVDRPNFPESFDWAVEVGFLPGVTDNVGSTATEMTEDALKISLDEGKRAFSSRVYLISGNLTEEDVRGIVDELHNPLIHRAGVKDYETFIRENGMDVVAPEVRLLSKPETSVVDINLDDEALQRLGRLGIPDHLSELDKAEYEKKLETYKDDPLRRGNFIEKDGKFFEVKRRGPLALSVDYLHAIQDYFRKEGRKPTDIELESLAQTWSEHCKHTIFADPIDDIEEGLFRHYIKRSTDEIRRRKVERGEEDICVSVFHDNAGVIMFDENNYVCLKVETHNSPSALDPYGGSITGIVGVNRDPLGTGMGSLPVLNLAGPYCEGDPEDRTHLYKGPNFTQRMLPTGRILSGIIDGVKDGGNCSGIPTAFFSNIHERRYKGKPLVFVGTIGLMPREVMGEPSEKKAARPGDYIVMAGGRVGKDGIHGATFSSEGMDESSPATAVQIGDPITQKKLSDAQQELMLKGLYNSVTDNGAGGLSCSVAEMAEECGGCSVQLADVPLKYPGMMPWETWISESQERMTYSVPREKWDSFRKLMDKHGVESTVIGEFNDSGRCVSSHGNRKVMDIDMRFLHHGLPPVQLKTKYDRPEHEEPSIDDVADHNSLLLGMISRKNIASHEYINQQYDHEVQGGSVLKPLQGRGRVNGDAMVARPVLESDRGVVVSQGVNPTYSDIDTYHMAASAIDTAVRKAVAAGAALDRLALLDNFCWSSSDDPQRLGELKEACRACYEVSTGYETPFVSGKDSMFNDFKGYDENGEPVKISVPPTLLVTAVGVMDSANVVSIDAKAEGDLVYVLGETKDETGASEYFAMAGEDERGEAYTGNAVPQVDAGRNIRLYRAVEQAVKEGVVASAKSVDRGGLGVALAKTAMAGRLGMDVSLEDLPGDASRDDFALYSESQGRMIVTIDPKDRERLEEILSCKGVSSQSYSQIGTVTGGSAGGGMFNVRGKEGNRIMSLDVDEMLDRYRSTFEEY